METRAQILFVDDETCVLSSVRRLFRRAGTDVLTAKNADDGLRILDDQPIDVVVTDYRMPDMSGTQFLDVVKARHPDTRRLILSGFADREAIERGVMTGTVDEYLQKPWNDATLKESIQQHIEIRRSRAEVANDQIRILVVDDEELMLSMMRRMFRQSTWTIDYALTATDAMRQLEHETYDLVLSDVLMPGISGIALMQEIRNRRPDLPVVLMTGLPAVDAAVQCIKLGAAHYVPKPFEREDLETVIREVLANAKNDADQVADCTVVMDAPPREIAGYEIARIIGAGNMGTVYEARYGSRRYALKMLLNEPSQGGFANAHARFSREAGVLRNIHHPHVVALVEYGHTGRNNDAYIVMDYIEGRTLKRMFDDGTVFTLTQQLHILRQIANALACIHEHGVVHRDIKPGNIMVNDAQHVTVMDFGVARTENSDLTQSAHLVGSPAYLPPEAYDASQILDPRADLFSLGVLAFEMFAGQRPFTGKSVGQLARQICVEEPPDIWQHVPTLAIEIRDLVMTLLQGDRNRRYQSANEVVADLEQAISLSEDAS